MDDSPVSMHTNCISNSATLSNEIFVLLLSALCVCKENGLKHLGKLQCCESVMYWCAAVYVETI